MRTYTDVFIHDDDEVKLSQLETGKWVLRYDTIAIFLTDEQVKKLSGAIGRIYWDLDIPMVLIDPEEEYNA
jgi:hypothetical protein